MFNKPGFYHSSGLPCAYADSRQVTDFIYVLQCNLLYASVNGRLYKVRQGFRHDGASKGFLRHFGRFTNAAILHDALYTAQVTTRAEADGMFLEAMKVSHVCLGRRYLYWIAVRLFGWAAWNNHEINKSVIRRLR